MITVTAFDGGGTGRYAEDIAIGLSERGFRVVIVTDFGGTDRAARLKTAAIPVTELGSENRWTRSGYKFALNLAVERFHPRLIHANAWVRHSEIAHTAKAAGVPLIFTGHSTPPPARMREWLGIGRVPFGLYRERRLLKRQAALICISNLALDNMRSRIGRGLRSVVVYNGVPVLPAQKEPATAPRIPHLVWIGSLIERKRPMLAVRVFRKVLESFPAARMSMVGEGPLMPELLRAADALPPGSLILTGYSDSVASILSRSTVYLQTSAAEGLPYSVLEAMSAGLPVVTTDAGATREAVIHGETGLVCPLDDLNGLSHAILRLLSAPETMKAYGTMGLDRINRFFSLKKMSLETLAAYKSLCGVDLLRP